MQRKKEASLVLIGCILSILIAYGLWNLMPQIPYALGQILRGNVIKEAQRLMFASLLYEETDTENDVCTWVIQKVTAESPLEQYVKDSERTTVDAEDAETYQMILKSQAEDENAVDENGELIGKAEQVEETTSAVPTVDTSMEKLQNYEYLVGNFYTVDSSTMIDEQLLNAETLMNEDLKIDNTTGGEKILIYHTHSQEMFADSVEGDVNTSIVGVGRYLTELLEEKYGIATLHHEGVYDLVNGVLDRSMAYDLAEPEIAQILADHPTIEVVIDLHRDGVADDTHLVTEVNGKQTAQIMFFNGLSRTRANGDIDYLPNPYIQDNLAFSLQLQIEAARKYPGFTRHIYLRGYRYNMHLAPRTLLIEAGAQTNTVEEMKNAMEVLADILNEVLTG